jgi:hypothetical protein
MLIRVEHSTAYSYSRAFAVEHAISTNEDLRMKPLSGRTQTVESWKLSCPGAVSTAWQVYRRNSLKKEFTIRLEDDDPYLQAIRDRWGAHSPCYSP